MRFGGPSEAFTGHTRRFYSVAEHSVLVSHRVPQEHALWGLLHDASEAYLVDLCLPLKRYSALGDRYREIEAKVMAVIAERYGLQGDEPLEVKMVDERMLMTEKRDLLGPSPIEWPQTALPFPQRVEGWAPELAEEVFMQRFTDLMRTR